VESEPRVSCMLGKHSTTEQHLQPSTYVLMVSFKLV
jgi:hypothetical protein